MSFCICCGKHIQPKIIERRTPCSVRGTRFEYDELLAFCPDCHSEVYTPETNDANVGRRTLAFEAARSRGTDDART